MERIKGAITLLLGLVALLGCRVRSRWHRAADNGGTAREVLNQPPRPVRSDDDDTPTVPTPHW
ncbi:hypothetical protein ACIBI8_04810 [Streptomyces sp. NPDC050529]|uniref:hypothetical protein n=1 Tax=unclassified Streptomyces TaxID=2593676 RepID=UPI002DD93615|nr:hypothetical protein [Streptomyces sp. NBC_01022]MEE4495568.1 hypothetical protein [Streptomyces sp. BE230]WRZ79943.1 hypothetical protein OG316_06545 [Streptomyces sp. NBC_01022]